MTVAEALRLAATRLLGAGVPDSAWDAEALLRHVLGWDRAKVVAESPSLLPPDAEGRFFALVEQRARRRPLQHLTGTQHFWRHEFLVGPDVLIPRPETELVVEAALDLLRDVRAPLIVDVGTGSGCIALSLAAERPDAEVHAVDISPAALAVAEENARRLGLEGRVRLHLGDLLEPLVGLAGRIELVASNPPYVDAAENLAPEVRDHEPALALFPPADVRSVYRRLAPQACGLLRAGGWLVVEVGKGMEGEVGRLCEEAGLAVERVIPDVQSIPRALVTRRSPSASNASGIRREARKKS